LTDTQKAFKEYSVIDTTPVKTLVHPDSLKFTTEVLEVNISKDTRNNLAYHGSRSVSV
jgi:hypothetical protein